MQVEHHGVGHDCCEAEWVGETIRQSQALGDVSERPVRISQYPANLRGGLPGADTRIVAAINMPVRAMLLRVINPNARLGMPIGVHRIAAEQARCPGTMMGLEA
jgi:hypothetical protein